MANNNSSMPAAPKKRRWYKNIADAYGVVKRSYKWLPAALIVLPILLIAVGILLGVLTSGWVFWILSAVLVALLVDMSLLAYLLRPAMYKQVDGKVGSVYAALAQIRRGWVKDEEPVAVNKNQDLVWRIVGRPGVVLISEGPSNRVIPLLKNEQKRIQRAITNVPIILIQVGHGEGQVPLSKLESKLRKQKKTLTKNEVPAVANRLNAIGSRGVPIPKGIDPYKARSGSRKALRG